MAQKRKLTMTFMDNWLGKKAKQCSSQLSETESDEADISQSSLQPASSCSSGTVEQSCSESVSDTDISQTTTDPSSSSYSVSAVQNSSKAVSQDFPPDLAAELKHGSFQPEDVTSLQIPVQLIHGKTRRFQSAWFQRFPWLHYSRHLRSVVCYTCAKATSMSLTELSTKSQQTFITTGFVDWKKAIEKFDDHEKSAHHKHAVAYCSYTSIHQHRL